MISSKIEYYNKLVETIHEEDIVITNKYGIGKVVGIEKWNEGDALCMNYLVECENGICRKLTVGEVVRWYNYV